MTKSKEDKVKDFSDLLDSLQNTEDKKKIERLSIQINYY